MPRSYQSLVVARRSRRDSVIIAGEARAPAGSTCWSVSFCIRLALENDGQTLLILRHHRGLPATPHPLVEQVGKRILIFPRVARESVDDRLVFFHGREDSSFPPMATTPAFANLTLVRHPLVQHKITLLRDRRTPTKIFKELVDEIAMLMAYEATADLSLDPSTVQTPLEQATGYQVSGKKLTLVPILRAGLGMVEGILRLVPSARVGHVGLYRDHDTLEPVDYYFKVPSDAAERDFFVLDPMLATGGSAVSAVSSLKRAGGLGFGFSVSSLRRRAYGDSALRIPTCQIYCAALDRELNAQGYILPGLGDAGDRLFGTAIVPTKSADATQTTPADSPAAGAPRRVSTAASACP